MQSIACNVTRLSERVMLTLPNMDSHSDWFELALASGQKFSELAITELCYLEFLNGTPAVFFNRCLPILIFEAQQAFYARCRKLTGLI